MAQIFELIPKVMQEVGPISKRQKNQQQGYAFRGIDDMYNAIQPIFAQHGVFVVPEVLEQQREDRPTRDGKGTLIYTMLKVRHTFYALDGSNVAAVTVGEAMDSGDKSSNKAMSAAMKYALIEVLAIPTEGDNDTENSSPQPAAKLQAAKPISEAEQYQILVREAFDVREFTDDQRRAAIVAVCHKHKVTSVDKLSEQKRKDFMKAIAEGTFDKLKNASKDKEA
jgi:hypothetical protein